MRIPLTAALVLLSLVRAGAAPIRLAILTGENEYQTAASLAAFAREHLPPSHWTVEWVQATPRPDDHVFTNVEAVARADLVLLSVRRRTPPPPLLGLLRAHLETGRPLAGLRTASHAFALRAGTPAPGHEDWPEFDREVLGVDYLDHLGPGTTRVTVDARVQSAPRWRGLPDAWTSTSTLYRAGKPDDRVEVLAWGERMDLGERHPVAWTRLHGRSRIFYTSLGAREDFATPAFTTLLENGLLWCADRPASALP